MNFAINIDRDLDQHVHFHGQLEVNAEGSQDSMGGSHLGASINASSRFMTTRLQQQASESPSMAGRGEGFSASARATIMVNEAYIHLDDWFTNGSGQRTGGILGSPDEL